MKRFFVLFFLSFFLSKNIFSVRIGQFAYLRYSADAFDDKSLDLNKTFTQIDLPLEFYNKNGTSAYALAGGQHSLKTNNPYTNDNFYYLGLAVNSEPSPEKSLGFVLAYYYYLNPDSTTLTHDVFFGVSSDLEVFWKIKLRRSLIFLRHIGYNFLVPAPIIELEREFGNHWNVKMLLFLDLKLDFITPITPTTLEATYKEKNIRAGFGYNFTETIQANPKQGDVYWQTGSRGLFFGFADYEIYKNYWAGIQMGMAYEMITNLNSEGVEIAKENDRTIPLFINLNLNYSI